MKKFKFIKNNSEDYKIILKKVQEIVIPKHLDVRNNDLEFTFKKELTEEQEQEIMNLMSPEEQAKRFNEIIKSKLVETDYTQLGDSPLGYFEKKRYANYRQALRDLSVGQPLPKLEDFKIEVPKIEEKPVVIENKKPWYDFWSK